MSSRAAGGLTIKVAFWNDNVFFAPAAGAWSRVLSQRWSFRTSFGVEGGPSTFPTRPSNPVHSLRGSHRPINAQECASNFIRSTAVAVDRSRVRTDATAEVRGDARAACETAYTGAVRSIHHQIPAVVISNALFMYYDSGPGKDLCSALASLPSSRSCSTAVRPGVLPCSSFSNGMRLLHHPRQHPPGLRDAPLPDQVEGLITHHFFDSLWPWASVRLHGP